MNSMYQPQEIEDREHQQQHHCQEIQMTTQECDGKGAGKKDKDVYGFLI